MPRCLLAEVAEVGGQVPRHRALFADGKIAAISDYGGYVHFFTELVLEHGLNGFFWIFTDFMRREAARERDSSGRAEAKLPKAGARRDWSG